MTSTFEQDLREMNEALLVSSVHQHELAEQAQQSEAALRESHARFETLFDASPIGMYLVDSEMRIRLVSKMARAVFGDVGELIGSDFVDVMHVLWPPATADEIVARFQHTLATGEPYCSPDFAEERYDRHVHEYYDWQIHRIALPAGKFGVVCYFIDVSERVLSTESLRQSETRYRRLFEEAKYGILILDIHTGTISDANPYMSELLGYSQDEFVGKELWELGLFGDKAANEAAFLELQQQGYLRYEHLPLETNHGKQAEVEVVANVYTEANHTVIQCSIRDITERRSAERALAKALAFGDDIIATLREPFLVLDSKLRVKTANRSFYDSFRVSKEETENQFVYELGNGQWDTPDLRTLLDQVLSRNQSVHDFEVEHTYPSLGRKTMLLNARPFPPDSKNPELILLAVYDISADRKRAAELAEASRYKDEFLATLAHELRNPLAPIRNAVQLLGMDGLQESDVKTARGVIARQVAVMVRLIDDLLDMSRISRNKFDIHKERVDLAEVIGNAVESALPLITSSKHEFVISWPAQPIVLDADPIRLAQALLNLLSNAAKYTAPGGHIWLSAEREEGNAVIRVRDDGTGIPSEMLTSIFDMFTQVDRPLERSKGGLGIGLTLVRRLVEMHDGRIEVHSQGRDQGSEFVVRLPLPVLPAVEPLSRSDLPVAKNLHGSRILVVDDNRDSADSLGMLLQLKGNEVAFAYDGVEALEAAEAFHPELVLLDIGLPKLNGYDVARRIRERPWGQQVILVALTGWGKDEDRRLSHEAGFDFHLVKPVELTVLETQLAGLSGATT